MSKKTIVILGGGAAGLVSANRLVKILGKEHRIILIDREDSHTFYPSFLYVMLGKRKPSQVKKTLGLLRRKGVEVVQAEILKIDPINRRVKTGIGDFFFDYLIIALGADLAPKTIPGLDRGYNLYALDGVTTLQAELSNFTAGNIAIAIAQTPFKCPAAPYEAALLLDHYFRQKGLRQDITIGVYTPESLPMPTAGPVLGNALKLMLDERAISFHPKLKLVQVNSNKLVFDNGNRAQFDLLVTIPVHQSPMVVRDSGLVSETGWIDVDRPTLNTSYDKIFAIGDVVSIKLPGRYQPDMPLMLPKAGVFAHYQAEVAAHNIGVEITGKGNKKEFDGKGYCFLEIGSGKAGFASGKFYAKPQPEVQLKNPGRRWHWGKLLFEKYWFWRFF